MWTMLATAPVDIRATGSCPSSIEVAQHLAELLPPTATANAAVRPPDIVQLGTGGPGGGGVTLTLRRADGTLLARKSLPRSAEVPLHGSPAPGATCADLAAAAALIIATWESDVHPEFKLDVPRRPRVDVPPDRRSDVALPRGRVTDRFPEASVPVPPPAAPAQFTPPPFLASLPAPERTAVSTLGGEHRRVSAEPLGTIRLRSSASVAGGGVAPARLEASANLPPPALPPAVAPPVSVTRVATPAPPRSPALMAPVVDVGAGVIGALSPSDHGVTGGAVLAGGWTSARHWGAHLALLATTERTTAFSAGQVNWRRVTLTLGPQHRWEFNRRRLNLDVRADGVAALLTVRGTGFASNSSDRTLDPGVGAAIRLAVGRGRWRPWLEFSTVGWLIRGLAYESPDNGALALPRVEAMLALGISSWNVM